MGQTLQKPELGPSDVREEEILKMAGKINIFSLEFQEAVLFLLYVYEAAGNS